MIIEGFTKEMIDEMSDEEVNFFFQRVQNEEAAKKMRQALKDIIDVYEAKAKTIKLN